MHRADESSSRAELLAAVRQLRRSSRRLKLLIVLLVLAAGGLATDRLRLWIEEHAEELNVVTVEEGAPQADAVTDLIAPLRYSGFPMLRRPEVRLVVNLDEGTWTVRHAHLYDAQGTLLLEEGHAGLCAELAVYAHQLVRPVLDARYQIQFSNVLHAGHFPAPGSAHYILRITDTASPEAVTYLLDPTFHRYGRRESFDDYVFVNTLEAMPFAVERDPDLTLPLILGLPLAIRQNHLLSLAIGPSGPVLDRKNVAMILTAKRRAQFSGQLLLRMRLKEGNYELVENARMIAKVFGNVEEYRRLKARLKDLFDTVEFTGTTPWDLRKQAVWSHEPVAKDTRPFRIDSPDFSVERR